MNPKLVVFIVIFVTNSQICYSKRYDNYTLYSVAPDNIVQLKFLQSLESQKYIDLMFWRKPHKLYYDVQLVVCPIDRDFFVDRAGHFNLKLNVLVQDIQRAFDNQSIGRYSRLRVETYSWENYHTLDDVYQWLSDLALKFPNTVELYTIGKSSEGREILALVIDRGHAKEKAIIEGGIHGNEWISTEFVTYLAHELLYSDESDGKIFSLAKRYVWLLIPILNPDGYSYSQKEDRMWRKNRRFLGGAVGVDLNRNFNYSFGKFATTVDPKDDEYSGPTPFSEPETKALSDFVIQNHKNLRFYFAFHGYGQKIIIPYSDRINHVEDYLELENYGKQAISKMYKLYKTKYGVGTFYDTMGIRLSGNSASWVKKNFEVKYALTFLLRDNGSFGFALPMDQILPTCREMLVGMTEVMTAKQKRLRADLFSSGSLARLTHWLLVLCWAVVVLQ